MTIDRRRGFIRRAWEKRKPKGPTARARAKKARTLAAKERGAKDEVRLRDGVCRFPRCGCHRPRVSAMKRVPTVSHDFHKGMGGDPTGGVSIAPLMMLLCKWRHQDAPVSKHAGTMKAEYLTPDQNDGPVAFLVDLRAVYPGLYEKAAWFEVAREHYVEGGSGALRLEPLSAEQEQVLDDLAEMTR